MIRTLSKLTVVDVMVAIAILMILSAIILPRVASEYTKINPLGHAHAAAVASPR
jgi:hypothetical protein